MSSFVCYWSSGQSYGYNRARFEHRPSLLIPLLLATKRTHALPYKRDPAVSVKEKDSWDCTCANLSTAHQLCKAIRAINYCSVKLALWLSLQAYREKHKLIS